MLTESELHEYEMLNKISYDFRDLSTRVNERDPIVDSLCDRLTVLVNKSRQQIFTDSKELTW